MKIEIGGELSQQQLHFGILTVERDGGGTEILKLVSTFNKSLIHPT